MPLKHSTETLLVLLLGAVTILAGVLVDTLPLLPEGILPWAMIFVPLLAYPFALSPTFRENRAEHTFRVLHFVPAVLALLWLLIQLASLIEPEVLRLHHWYTWGWTSTGVVVGFVFLLWFCLRAVRRWAARMSLLFLIVIPFIVLGTVSEEFADWDQQLAQVLWRGTWWDISGTGGTFVTQMFPRGDWEADEEEFPHSADRKEEAWRERLRAVEARRRRILERRARGEEEITSMSSEPAVPPPSSDDVRPPPRLPKSGMDFGMLGVTFFAVYSALLHDRARRRIG